MSYKKISTEKNEISITYFHNKQLTLRYKKHKKFNLT